MLIFFKILSTFIYYFKTVIIFYLYNLLKKQYPLIKNKLSVCLIILDTIFNKKIKNSVAFVNGKLLGFNFYFWHK